MNKKLIIFLGVLSALLLRANFVLALEIKYPNILGQSLNNTSSFPEYACYLFSVGVALAISIAVISILFGGIYYLVSYGRGKFTSEGKDWMKAGITGLLIVVCASLIAYTINPNLTTCKLGFLPYINIGLPGSVTNLPPGVETKVYNEIPIGTLTETLLTRTMDCYGFDQSGNPVDGDTATKNVFEPTYMLHDRADCITQLVDGAQKKAQVIATLSSEITKLMDQCDCKKYGNCTNDCNKDGNGCVQPPQNCLLNQTCTAGACVGAACQQPPGTTDCCPTGIKNKIEHGPVDISVDVSGGSGSGSCKINSAGYKGLDEFRCPVAGLKIQNCSGIPALVEKRVQINNKVVVIIDKDKWAQLNLIQQLTYFKEKIEEIKQKIKKDEDVLDQARANLGKCYLAITYVDLVKNYESTDMQNTVIVTQETFSDPETNKKIDASKYCDGFNYNNSDCLKTCNDLCPDSSPAAINLYKQCPACQESDFNCLARQKICIENAYNSRPCIYGKNPSQKFSACISSCQNDCSNNCAKKYLPCSDELKFCQKQCKNNSQCVLDPNTSGKCLFGATNLQQCASQATDPGNASFCVNNAYLCENGSNQYAGYQDCADTLVTKCSTYSYSASSFYDNPQCQKCPSPYSSPAQGTTCYSGDNTSDFCQEICPETAKCPSASKCPTCPCDQIDETLSFSVPKTSVSDKKSKNYNAGNEGYITSKQKISAHQIVGPQCNNYSLNDDPLTFYCQVSPAWYNDPSKESTDSTPKGATLKVELSTEGEIPVGQTVDDAKNWAEALMKNADKINQSIQKMLTQMEKIGKAKDTNPVQNYCRCDAKFDTNTPICTTGCEYLISVSPKGLVSCSCAPTPCEGSPCQQIINYQSELWNNYRQLKLDFIDFYTNALTEPRSDIMKELTYSRQTVDKCSLKISAPGSTTRLLNCTRVKDELINPIITRQIKFGSETISSYCYGRDLGKALTKPIDLTDNWFCAEKWSK